MLISKGISFDSVTFTVSYFDFVINTSFQFSVYRNCRYTSTDYSGGDLDKATLDTEETCVVNCLENPDCNAITFISPNPSQYNSNLHGCLRKSSGWTVSTGTDYTANMVSVDVTCIRAKTGNCSLCTSNIHLTIFPKTKNISLDCS